MKALINHPAANLYAQPCANSEVVSQALYGWQVMVLDEQHLFKKIQTKDAYEGWIENSFLSPFSLLQTVSSLFKIIHNAVHLYSLPNLKQQKPLLTLPFEVHLKIISEPEQENLRWIEVELIDQTKAWIQRRNGVLNPPNLTHDQMVTLSHQFLGLPYTWGGVSSFGYDCSGFVQMLFRQKGILLPRDAYLQAASPLCKPIEMEQLVAGDLIFFGQSAAKITHVGFYLGNQCMIHASAQPIPLIQTTWLGDLDLQQRYPYRTGRAIQ